jgi:patatin-like phospholipase
MTALALELHEVLYEEYLRLGGKPLPSPDAAIVADDILDATEAKERIALEQKVEVNDLVDRLEEYRQNVADDAAERLCQIKGARPRLTPGTVRLKSSYAEASPEWRRRINRRILEDILGPSFRGAAAWPEITADQITDSDGCPGALASFKIEGPHYTAAAMAASLEALRVQTDPADEKRCPAKLFGTSSRLTPNTRILVDAYDSYDPATRTIINRRIIDDVFGDSIVRWRDVALGRVYNELHKEKKEEARAALCISGGGIRSATFALGVLQGLASRGILKRFDYLSTVSGGGYIGSWLSSWIRRHPEGVAGVERDLAAVDSRPAVDSEAKLQPEAKPIRHLREYSNYLTPRTGVTSGDTWAFAALYVRNLLINLLVIVPILAALLAIPRVSAWGLRHIENDWPLWPIVLVTDLSLLAMFWYIGIMRPVTHGSEAKRPIWPIDKLSPRTRFVAFCFLSGVGAATGMSAMWAKWVALTTPLTKPPKVVSPSDTLTMQIGLAVAILCMTVVPCWAYFRRYVLATYAARRESIAAGSDATNRRIMNERIVFESVAATVAAIGAIALYWFFAKKVFDQPLTGLFEINGLSPFLLANKSLASPRLLFICFGAPTVLFILFMQATVFVAASSRHNEDYDREWWGRAGGWLLSGSVVWLLLSGVSIFGPLAIYRFPAIVGSLGGISGLVAILLGRSPKSSAGQKADAASARSDKALALATPLFCLFLLASISWLTTVIIQKVRDTEAVDRTVEAQLQSVVSAQETPVDGHPEYTEVRRTLPLASPSMEVLRSYAHLKSVETTSGTEWLILFLVALAAFGASFAIGANRFSMHALYRNRLIRAYLGASRYDRDPDHVTGFDPYDNIQIYKLRPELLWTSSFTNVGAFIEELRNAMAAQPCIELSTKLVSLLQETTLEMLADVKTLDTVIEHLTNAAADASRMPLAREVLARVNTHLPYAAKLMSRNAPIEKVVAAAEKELKKRRPILESSEIRGLIDTVVQDVNRILIEKDLTGEAVVPALRAQSNRRLFDATYADWVIGMPAPDGDDQRRRLLAPAPLHVVNTALNLVSGDNLAWQQRQAESFTISPLHSGSAFVGYRDSREYGDRRRGISLGTAVTISGAAASPNQGYHSSLALAFLLTMFNVRLGWWLGNPGPAGDDTYGEENPSSTVDMLRREMLGDTSDTSEWVYLSDGGHFENLGMYEMVLRRCRYIVVSDGGCDPKFTFEDLGNAIRKIRLDFGIPITFEPMAMHSRDDDTPFSYAAVGRINYAAVDGPGAAEGTLIYVKPGYYVEDEDLPRDVVNYAKECDDFPHESTADQWFSESQFESYRALGRHVIERVVEKDKRNAADASVAAFAKNVEDTVIASQETAYVPVVAEQLRIKGDRRRTATLVMPTQVLKQPEA